MRDIRLNGGYASVIVGDPNDQARTIPLCKELQAALKTYLAAANLPPDSPLFPARDGQPITYKVLRRRFAQWKTRAGLGGTDYTLSSLSHSFAVRLVARDNPSGAYSRVLTLV